MSRGNVICPYCGNHYQVKDEDYSEFRRAETCVKCGKKYDRYDSGDINIYHHAIADCLLNRESHKWDSGMCSRCGMLKGEAVWADVEKTVWANLEIEEAYEND